MSNDLTFLSLPRISLDQFTRILRDAHSPAASEVGACYAAIVRHGVDPAIGLAFFQHESGYGLQGIARETRNWGNLRRGQGRQLPGNVSGFARYSQWADSADDWTTLIATVYVRGRGLTTVRQALPVYAPSSDGNTPAAYADAVIALVQRWQAQATNPWAAWGSAHPLPEEQREFAIPAAWLADGGLGAAESDEIPTPRGAGRLFSRGAIVWDRTHNTTRIYR